MPLKPSASPKVAEFIDCIMVGAVILHKMHLRVQGLGSYAAHKALNELYDALPEHADDLTEKYQGYNGVIIENYPSMDQTPYLKMEPLAYVEWLMKYVEDNRSCFGTTTMLQNLLDELTASIAETRYKLKFLS
jgi:DNA-binding ferritin-like protein